MRLEEINFDRVSEVIATQPLADYDREVVGGMVVDAAVKWALSDAETMTVLEIEKEWREGLAFGRIDLIGDRQGVPVIVDWKTADKLDDWWEKRLRASWQPKIYGIPLLDKIVEVGKANIEFRGITRAGLTRTVKFSIGVQEVICSRHYLLQVRLMRDSLDGTKWPLRMPSGCYQYGPYYPCEFLDDCREGIAPPGRPNMGEPLDYTGAEEFLRCPERYRRLKLLEQTGVERGVNARADFGTAFHAGISEVYAQVKEWQKCTINMGILKTIPKPVNIKRGEE